MSVLVPSHILRIDDARREEIASIWYRAVADTSFTRLTRRELREQFAILTDQIVDALLAQPYRPDQAHAVGVSLAKLHFLQPEALGRTQEVLARELVAGLSAEHVSAVQPR